MSAIELLATFDFRVPFHSKQSDRRGTVFSINRTDPVALPVTEVLRELLQSSGFRVGSPKKEGRGTYFRCLGDSHDIGIAVTVMGRAGDMADVSLAFARLSKRGKSTSSSQGELNIAEVVRVISTGLARRFQDADGFVVTDQWRRPN